MKPVPPLRLFFSAFVTTTLFGSVASAHPGHDHSDIPATIRHPLAGVEHVVVVAAVVLVVAAAMYLAGKAWRGASRHGAHPRTVRTR